MVLVQLPDSKAGDAKQETVVNYLLEKGISTENGLLAIWLSNEKINLEGIRDMDSPIQFLLFKQAVATGWDCPRAQVLVMFRDIRSEPFKIQTVGRILRMPEQKHYLKEDLNRGYVYTNIYPLSVEEEAGEPTGILQNITVRKRAGLENVSLVSYYRQRADYNDLTTSFYALQNRVFCEAFGLDTYGLVDQEENHRRIQALGMNFDLGRSDVKMGKEGMMVMDRYDDYGYTTKNIDLTEHVTHISDSDVQFAFDKMLLGFLGTYNRARSLPTLRKSLYDWFSRHFAYSPMNGGVLAVQHVVLRPENMDKIKTALQKAVDEYAPLRVNEVESKAKDKTNPNWHVAESAQYSDLTDELFPTKLHFYNECWLSKTRSAPEKAFEKWLEGKSEQLEWWYKNGESKETYFGVQYTDGEVTRTFYPDYLVRFKNGSIGIFDTKDGMTAKDAGLRSEALQRYFKEYGGNGEKGLWGGILVERTSGVWMLNQSEAYRFDGKDWSSWVFLEEIVNA